MLCDDAGMKNLVDDLRHVNGLHLRVREVVAAGQSEKLVHVPRLSSNKKKKKLKRKKKKEKR